MVTYKNIRIKMKNGKTRTQRVQVLASGKYKFVKNTGTTRKSSTKRRKTKTRRTRTMPRKKKSYRSRAKGVIGKYGMTGLAEDAVIGYVGSQILMGQGYPLESALPMTRIIQGVAGKALKRRGAGRLEHGVIDLIDVYLIRQGFNLSKIGLKAWA